MPMQRVSLHHRWQENLSFGLQNLSSWGQRHSMVLNQRNILAYIFLVRRSGGRVAKVFDMSYLDERKDLEPSNSVLKPSTRCRSFFPRKREGSGCIVSLERELVLECGRFETD